tara:strand:- start:2856 stop:4805 length:1950 start_codon:yes stop_codon:yes gene_type:complete
MLHVNQKNIPGYISDDVPCGIFNYKLDQETQRVLEKIFPGIILRKTSEKKPIIQTILLMGSLGSIAQTKKSDLDYTLLIDKSDFTPESMKLFERKLKAIEDWTWKQYHLETHFFVNDINEVRENNFGESDSESTGTAMAKLLKEEMYRTMIIVAGRIPFWWIVPVETDDNNYIKFFNKVQQRQTLLHREEFVDIGNCDDISPGEFFGGAIWALIKSFKSPFKTLMKMSLLEQYVFGHSKSNLLCHEIKKHVFNGTKPYIEIDPYITMFKRVENFFMENKTDKETEALRTAFYLKVGTQVQGEEMGKGSDIYRKDTLINLLNEWEWTAYKVDEINQYSLWQMHQKVELGNRINEILMGSYKNISDKNKSQEGGKSLITEKDTHLLGRKLFSFYNKAPYKVETIFVDGNTAEKELTFYLHQENARDKGVWHAIRGQTLDSLDAIDPGEILKKAFTLESICSFIAMNGLFSKETKILMRGGETAMKDHDVFNLLIHLSSFISKVNIANISNEDLLAEAYIKQLFCVINYGYPFPREIMFADPREAKTNKELGEFIRRRVERVKSMTYIIMNSWGELFCKTFAGLNSMGRCINDLALKVSLDQIDQPKFLRVYIPTGLKEGDFKLPWLENYTLKALKLKGAAKTNKAAAVPVS